MIKWKQIHGFANQLFGHSPGNVRAEICSAAEAKAELEDFKVLFSG